MRRHSLHLIALLAGSLLVPACKVYDPLYCDVDKQCEDPERPFCDLNGEYPASEGIKKTCIPSPTVGDFAITPVDDSVQVRIGGELAVDLQIERRDGFTGEIAIVADGLPDGVTAESAVVAADADLGTLVIRADTAEPGSLSKVRVVATSGDLEHVATVDLLFLGAAGTLDPTFGVFGLTSEPDTEGPRADRSNSLLQLSDGTLLVGGDSVQNGTGSLFRLMPDGTVDTTFGTMGLVAFGFDRVGGLLSAHPEFGSQAGDKVVLAAAHERKIVVGRMDRDGFFDGAFEDGGMFAHPSAFSVSMAALAIGPRDEILVGLTTGTNRDRIQIVRFGADGAHDESFAGGLFNLDQGDFHLFETLRVLGDGAVLGVASAEKGAVRTAFVFKLTAHGALDSTFAEGGIHLFATSESPEVALGLEDGSVLVAGSTVGESPLRDPTLWRLTATGELDEAFGRSGTLRLALPADRYGAVNGLLPTSGGQVLAFGSPGLTLIRLDPTTGILDGSFGNDGTAVVDLNPAVSAVAAVRRDDGRLLVLADEDSFDFVVARFFE